VKKLFLLSMVAVGFLGLGACSKKDVSEEGDMAGDVSATNSSLPMGVAPGTRIPELSTVYFEYDSFNLTSDAKSALNAAAQWLKANPSAQIQVEGHTDERGTTEYNLALGERRAGAVKDFLVMAGVPAAQVSTISYGEERPVGVGSNEQAWSQNRRAEFVAAGY
jgi:peptidoglycan-associated lipoprotein